MSGITGFNQTLGMNRFRCDLCVYDLCEKCYNSRKAVGSSHQKQECNPGSSSTADPSLTPTSGGWMSQNVSTSGQVSTEATNGGVEAPPAVPAPRAAATPGKVRALCAKPVPGTGGAPWAWQDAPAAGGPTLNPWSVDCAYRLEGGADIVSRLAGQVRVLDAETIASVNLAIELLNKGSIHCPEDMCIVYSTSNQGYYLLHKRGKREAALASVGVQDQRLYTGLVLTIGGCKCQVTSALGTGSFGTVWAAECLEGGPGGEVAIKEIQCRSSAELSNAAFEGKLLEMIQGHSRACGSSYKPGGGRDSRAMSGSRDPLDRMPDLVGTETESTGTEMWRVRLAMTKVPGVPIDRFLEAWRRKRNSGNVSITAQQHFDFVEACSVASELVLQLAPTFEHIAKLAYHRDVNSHNILVDGDASNPVFGLVDFGLAVDLAKWQGPVSSQSWHLVDIGGDCRYWPMSAWLQFECGWQELSKYPPLSAEYQQQLDFHALGITALQILAAMAPQVDDDNLAPQFKALQVAWERYWEDATRFWQRLLEVFRHGGDQNALKVSCITEGVHNIVGADLAALRLALRDAFDACSASGPQAGLRQFRPLFAALLELISAGGTVGFEENKRPPTWQEVYKLAAATEAAACFSPSRAQAELQAGVAAQEKQAQRCSMPLSHRNTTASARSVLK